MRFWERFSKIIFKSIALRYLQKFQDYPLERVLRHSSDMLDADTINEVKSYVISQQTVSGAFADKAGRGDLYYTLFGCFVAEALGITGTLPGLKQYVREIVQRDKLSGVHLHCAAILYAKLFSPEALTSDMRSKIRATIGNSDTNEGYNSFLNVLTCYYVEDYKGLNTVKKQLEVLQKNSEAPCPVCAAMLVLEHSFNKPADLIEKRLRSFYRNNGSYAAVRHAPTGDLLSTAVALYALSFAKADIRIIKPDCLAYIDSLYTGGGFCATPDDDIPDIEYTFYGLLALGALSTAS